MGRAWSAIFYFKPECILIAASIPALTENTFRGVIGPIFTVWVQETYDMFNTWLESDTMKWIRNSLVAIRVPDGDYMYVECFNTRLIMGKKQFSDNQLQHMV